MLKLEPGFQTGLIHLLASSCPKLVFRPQTPNVTALVSKSFFLSNSIKFCMKQALIFKFCVIFDKVMSVLFPENYKKPIKNLLFGAIPESVLNFVGRVPLCLHGYFVGSQFFVGISCGYCMGPNFFLVVFGGSQIFLVSIL